MVLIIVKIVRKTFFFISKNNINNINNSNDENTNITVNNSNNNNIDSKKARNSKYSNKIIDFNNSNSIIIIITIILITNDFILKWFSPHLVLSFLSLLLGFFCSTNVVRFSTTSLLL